MPFVKPLVASIIQFLNDQLQESTLTSDAKESLEVAIQCLETAYSMSSSNTDTSAQRPEHSLLEIYSQAMKAQGGTAFQQEASDDDKLEAEMLKNEGNCLMKAERFEEALECYTKAITLDSHNAVYYCNRAAAYSKLNQFNDAIHDCKKAVDIDPKYSKAYGRMGLAYASLESHTQAKDCYKQAVELDPTNESYLNNLRVAEAKLADTRTNAQPAGRSPLDLSGLLNNPALMNMATQLMSDPNMQNMMTGLMSSSLNQTPTPNAGTNIPPAGPPPTAAPGGFDALLHAGQQLAAQMQAANPDLVEQLRRQMANDPNGPSGNVNNRGDGSPN